VKHIFVTQDFGPDRGGMARRHVELCRRFGDDANSMSVSTVRFEGSGPFDRGENYPIHRQPFPFSEANRFANQVRWAAWLTENCRDIAVFHCGNIRPVGYAVVWASARLGIPYVVYVNGGDLLREREKSRRNVVKKATAKRLLGGAAGIAATSAWVAELAAEVMREIGVTSPPAIGAMDLGTDPNAFSPDRDSGAMRKEWGIGDAPVILTVARLVPHKGQDTIIRAVGLLKDEFPGLRYVMVGEGHDERRLRALAEELGVAGMVIFAGPIGDAELAEAYATSTVYVGASRLDNDINVEGFGISFLEAAASGIPVVAGDSGGVRSAVRDGETGLVVPPSDADAFAAAIRGFLVDAEKRKSFGSAGRAAVESHFNWDRVARDTREFTLEVTKGKKCR
jgi:phosphatidylinositol alpha-1,6-mannosyltransferase